MAEKLLIIMMNTEPTQTEAVAASLFQATIAASMEFAVEIVFTGCAGPLARQGVAEGIALHEGASQNVHDLIREAHEAGVVFKVCNPAIEAAQSEIIPEVEESVGSAYVVAETMSEETVTLTY